MADPIKPPAPERPKYVLPNGEVMHPSDERGEAMLKGWGATPISGELKRKDDLAKKYSSWRYLPAAIGEGLTRGALPGAEAADLGVLEATDPAKAKERADFIEGMHEAHPMAGTLSMLAGAGAVGIATGGTSLLAAPFIGAAMAADDLALKHIQTPEGAEKVFAELGVGALLGLGFGAAGKFGGKLLASGALAKAGAATERQGQEVLMATNLPGKSAKWLDAKGQLEDAKAYFINNDLVGQSPKEVRSFLNTRAKATDAMLKEVRTATKGQTLDAGTQGELASDLVNELAGTGVEKSMMKLKSTTKLADVGQLHDLRMKIDRRINWNDPTSQFSQQLIRGRDMISSTIEDHLRTLSANQTLADQLPRWLEANKEFATLSNIRGAFAEVGPKAGKGVIGTISGWASKLGSAVMSAGVLGVPHADPMVGLVMKEVAHAMPSPRAVVGNAAVGLGRFLQSFDERVVQTVVSKLGGEAVVGGTEQALRTATVGLYGNIASWAHIVKDNPTSAIPTMAQTMVEAGVPMEVAQSAAPVALKAIEHATAMLPQNPWTGQTVAPVPYSPPLHAKVQFMDAINTIANPVGVLAGTPTPQQMATLRAVYPELSRRLNEIVMDQMAHSPNLKPAARRWASAVTGIPAGPLDIPNVRAMMNLSDAKMQQERQLAAQQQGSGQPQTTDSDPLKQFQTRVQRLSK